MITKEQREKDRAICEAATAGEWQECGHSVFVAGSQGEPRADWVANVWYPRLPHDRAAIANAVNRLPVYIADAEEMERRIAEIETLAPLRSGTWRDEGATLNMVFRILRGQP